MNSYHISRSIPSLAIILLLMRCNQNEPPLGLPASMDTSWATHLQFDMPWPGLESSPWPMFLHDPQHTGRSPHRGPQEGRVEWYYETGGFVYSSAALGSDGTIYTQSWDGFLYALSSGGGLKWKFNLGSASDGITTIGSDGTIYTGAIGNTGNFYALDENGNAKWTFRTGGSGHWSAPVLSYDGQTIYFIAGDSSSNGRSLFALRRDGTLKWKYTPLANDLINFSIALSPSGLIICPGIGQNQAPIYAVDSTGAMRWRFVATGMGTNITTSSPCIDNDGNIYFACDRTLYSLSHEGILRWQTVGVNVSGDIGPVLGRDGTLYISGGSHISAFDYAGRLKWKYPVQTSQSIPAIDIDGTIYVGTNTFRASADTVDFLALNPDGSVRFKLSLREMDGRVADIVSRPAISGDGSIYVGSDQPQSHRVFKIK